MADSDEKIIGDCTSCGCDLFDEDFSCDGEMYCESCFRELPVCKNCNETHASSDEGELYNGVEWYCDRCIEEYFIHCHSCGDLTRDRDANSVACGDSVCSTCFENDFFTCESCEEVYSNDDYGENGLCESCFDAANDENDENSIIHAYHYQPTLVFYGDGNLHFGVEIEMVAGTVDSDSLSMADSLPNWLYAKEDASIAGSGCSYTIRDGFEMVSHPMSWDWLKAHRKEWAEVLARCRRMGFRSYDTKTCGMHVHFSKAPLSSLHLYKLLKFIYENPMFILRISRRRSRGVLDRWASVTADNDETIVLKAKDRKSHNGCRYTAVNLNNRDTVEIRVFRGTLAILGFWANLEFCHALITFARDAAIQNVSVDNFCAFVKAHQVEYANLSLLIERRLDADVYSDI